MTCADKQRANTASAIKVNGAPKSKALIPVHLPVPFCPGIALMWRGGCIIRSQFLNDIKEAYDNNPELENLLLADFFNNAIKESDAGWRETVVLGVQLAVPTPSFSSAFNPKLHVRNIDLAGGTA
jgi:6-phosphogluconate dehydrogenase (decarboxylating)